MLVNHLRAVSAGVLVTLEHVAFQLARLVLRRRRPRALPSPVVWEPAPGTPPRVLPPRITWQLPRDPHGPPN